MNHNVLSYLKYEMLQLFNKEQQNEIIQMFEIKLD